MRRPANDANRKRPALLPADSLLDHVNDGIVGSDADFRIIYWGKGAERIYGFSQAEALGKTTLELLRPVYEPGEREKILAEMDRHGTAVATLRTKHKDGTEVIAEVNSTRMIDERGDPSGYVVVYRDVTERSRARRALKEANDRLLSQAEELRLREEALRGILDATKESIWQFSPDGSVLLANDMALARMGKPAGEIIGKHFTQILPPKLAASRLAKLNEAVASRAPVEFEDERAGMIFRHSFYPVLDRNGRVTSVACFSRDISARKESEEALRQSEAKASALIKYAPTGIYEIDFRGPRFISVNDAMCRILGYTREELLALSPSDLLDEESRTRFAARIRRQMAGEALAEMVEYNVRKKDGELIHALLNVAVAPTPDEPYKVFVIAHDITPLKRMEEALVQARTEAERRARDLEVLMEAVPAGVTLTRDRDGLHISGNRTARELLRLPDADGNISRSAPDADERGLYRVLRNGLEIPPEDLPVQRAARGEEVRDWDCDLLFANGDVRHVIINATPLKDENGQLRGAVSAFIDVTDRRRNEQARRRDRERFELLSVTAGRLLESKTPQAVIDELCRRVLEHLDCRIFFNFLVDKDAGRLRLNACGGVPEAELPRLQWLDFGTAVCGYVAQNGVRFVAEDIQSRPNPRTDLVAAFGVTAYACHPLMAGDEVLGTLSFGATNRARFTEDELSLMKTVADQVSVAIERMRDQQALRERGLELQRLTETLDRRVRERTAELASANDRLKAEAAERIRLVAAVEQADEGIAIMDARGRIGYFNAAFTRFSGCGPTDLSAISYPQLLAGRDGQGDGWGAVQASIANGQAWRGHVSRDRAEGGTIELEVTVRPIQDAAGGPVAFLAVERDVTREVRLQQHLRQVQKLEALGTLAGGIAHDFNNILNPIFISTELLLLDSSLDQDDRQHLEIALKAAERGRDLVKQIIAFSRQKEKEKKPFRAAPVVHEAVKFLRVSLPSTVEIRADIRDEAGLVLGDPAQLHQVVMNLCNNAAYAMRDRGGVLTVSLVEDMADAGRAAEVPGLAPGPRLRLTVSDTGTGMTPEVRERAFDPFFTTKKPGEGSGLGLAVVDGVVRDYGGAVTVASEVGQGSMFTVYLPRLTRQVPPAEAAPDVLPRGSERVLLLDDEEVQVRSVRSMLERLGYTVSGFTDAAEALSGFRAAPQAFDVVITDQTMPQMTGSRIAEEFVRIRPDIPIILCTGFSETVDAHEARARGIREFMMKPYSVREMAEAVRRALDARP